MPGADVGGVRLIDMSIICALRFLSRRRGDAEATADRAGRDRRGRPPDTDAPARTTDMGTPAMTRRLRLPAAALAAGLALLSVAADTMAQAPAPATLVLPILSTRQLPAYIAEELGLWKAEGVDAKVSVVRGVAATNAVIAGNADFAFTGALAMQRAVAGGQALIAIAQMQNGLSHQIVLRADVAERLAVSRATLVRRFADVLGRGFHEELTTVRLREAKRLLAGTDLPLSAVADRCGFTYQQHMNRLFRNRLGTSPSAYRARHRRR